MEADRHRHRRGRHGQVRLGGADALMSAHRGRNAKVAGEIRDQRLGQIVAARNGVVVQPGVQLRRSDLVGAVDVDHVDKSQFPAGHRHRPVVSVGGRGHLGTRQVVADDVVGRHIKQCRHRDGATPALHHANHCGRCGAPFRDDIDVELDRWAHQHCAGEHSMHRAHRLLRKPFGHRDYHLREHLGAFHDLAFVLGGDAGIGDKTAVVGGACVEQVQ
jgi:hypothetical protein